MGRFDFKSLLILLVVVIVGVIIVKMFTKTTFVDTKGVVTGGETLSFGLPFSSPTA
jgi:uncharacterized transporter YbjL